MIYLTKVLSIDIRDRLVAVAYLGRSLWGIDLLESAVIQKEAASLSSMREGEENDYDPALVERLSSFLVEKKISQEETVLCIPRNIIMFKFVDLPSPDEASLPDILKYELERVIPMDPAEVYYDFRVTASEENNFRVLLAAVPRKVVDYYLGLLRSVGLAPTVLDISTFGSFNTGYFSDYDLSRPTAILDVSATDFEVMLVEDNALRFSRSMKISVPGWRKCFFGGTDFLSDNGQRMEALSDEILHGLEQSIRVAGEAGYEGPPERVLISGGGQSDQILSNYMQQKSKMETGLLVPSSSSIRTQDNLNGANCLNAAVGLGLGELKKSPVKINLLPPALRAKRKKNQIIVSFILLGLVVSSALGIAASMIVKDRLRLSGIEGQLNGIKKQVARVEAMELKREEIRARLVELKGLRENDVIPLDILKELTRILPLNTWLSSLNIQGNMIKFSGRSTSASSLIPLLDRSPLFKGVRFEGSVENRGGIEKFKIRMEKE